VTPGAKILIADNDKDWLRQLSLLVQQDELWMRLAVAGREFAWHDEWEVLGESLWRTSSGWVEGPAPHALTALSAK
jgi:hypothetical protein